MKASIDDYTQVVPLAKDKTATQPLIPGNAVFYVAGTCLLIYSITGAAQVKLDDGSFFAVRAGLKIKLPADDAFRKITFQNLATGATATVVFYTGTADIDIIKPV